MPRTFETIDADVLVLGGGVAGCIARVGGEFAVGLNDRLRAETKGGQQEKSKQRHTHVSGASA